MPWASGTTLATTNLNTKLHGRRVLVFVRLDIVVCFLCGWIRSHCDWNSILESVVSGVPLVAWPLFAETKTNVILVSEGTKVVVRVVIVENGLVERGEIGL